ncbi:MAG: inosine 5-monophosphate dehydrogenase [Elusimicrobia bacterium RIFCSPLOWO2_02_FULL_39_32]|nr:MAG: inosine 5-monophosphate dehydrogenase [Elusimicrobia bacterium RIFCSPHIGHO2_02_FULL_39_36]OGR91495.1 MAG: inosine 5-monophosphate dehydrogenase [Elusimicrobia bacterium RIFCSPLOWO2_02_FULL_39_32]OGS00750.1 MAG: inosine 5-monophosphate dehydrogenase [Elusimicrobia bacterium RIFCSPLOWO2_12_FULL_39_28]
MAFFIGKDREARRAYGFDEVALVPGLVTIDPEEVDVVSKIGDVNLKIPIIASAMDGVVDVNFAIEMGHCGGLAVLNSEGIQTRYEKPQEILKKIVTAKPDEVTNLLQQIYREPIKEELLKLRIQQIKKAGVPVALSAIPKRAERFAEIALEAGADLFFIQSTVTSVRHESSKYASVDFARICKNLKKKMAVVIGNCVTYDQALALMETGASGILVGIGPGAACTTRGVLGMGVPQVTSTVDCAQARDFYFKKTGKYISIITDGGMVTSGDICKAIASGADAVMIGSGLAKATESPGKGYHWGMAMPDRYLPRGTRVWVGTTALLREILLGPANVDDGTQNLVGALKVAMGSLGARNIKEMQLVEIIIAPDIKSEGKVYQKAQKLGMGK